VFGSTADSDADSTAEEKSASGEEEMDTSIEVMEAQWKAYVEKLRESGELSSALAICDVSGSMEGQPMEVSPPCILQMLGSSHLHRSAAQGSCSSHLLCMQLYPGCCSFAAACLANLTACLHVCAGGYSAVAADCRGDQAALQQAHLHLFFSP